MPSGEVKMLRPRLGLFYFYFIRWEGGFLHVKSEIPLPSDGFLFDLLEPWDVRVLSIRKTAYLPLQLWVGTFPRFVAIGFYFLSETLI
jgi:hypothetical protein